MSLVQIQSEFAQDVAELLMFASKQGFQVTLGEAQRTIEQAELYKKTGFSKAGANSLHCKRLAIDLNFFKDGKFITDSNELKVIGDYWESLHPNNAWGKYFSFADDYPHFSRGIDKPEAKRATS